MQNNDNWTTYLERFHAERTGITEAAFEHAHDPVVGTAYDWLRAALPARPGRVLDIACGSAPLHPRLSDAESYIGIDISHAELALAQRRARGPVIRADARRLPLPDNSADTVVSSMGLMLITPLVDALGEIVRVLRPGGTLAALLPARWPLRPRDARPLLAMASTLRAAAMPQHLSPRRITRELRHAGLTVAHVQRRRFPFPLHTTDDVTLAIRSLYTLGTTTQQLDQAVPRLTARLAAATELPLPLLRATATLPVSP